MKKLTILTAVAAVAAATLPQAAMAASCPTNFEFTNASDKDAIVTIHSKTRLNPGWTPKIVTPTRSQADQLLKLAAEGVKMAGTASGTAIPVDQAEPIAMRAIDAAYSLRDANMRQRTFVIKGSASKANVVVVLPITCRLQREYNFAIYCGSGRHYFDVVGLNGDRTIRRRICA